MANKPTVTIGIPAYNEEANIGNLLKSVLAQKGNFELEKVIIISDGSTDKTVEVAEKATSKNCLTMIVDNKGRKGKSAVFNEILALSGSDILITLDADIIIGDNFYFDKLIEPIAIRGADMVTGKLVPLLPQTFIEKVLYISVCLKREIIEEFRNGDNLYTCHGAGRAFSKKFYQQFRLPNVVAEDAFSYLWSKRENYKYEYSKIAKTYYKLPNNLKDHERQSVRFFQGRENLKEFFNTRLVDKSHKLPLILTARKTIKYILKSPVELMSYFLILGLMKLKSHKSPKTSLAWKIAKSTRPTT